MADETRTGVMGAVKRLYDWVLSWAESPWGPAALFVLSFCESSFFPIPPDPLLIALCLGAVRRSLLYAGICTLASVLGGLAGYAIGAFGFEMIGQPILEMYGKADQFEALLGGFREQGNIAVLIAALTPVPYKVVTISAGVASMNLPAFIMASVAGRGLRFFAVAGLIAWKGEVIAEFIDQHFEKLTILFSILLVGGFLAIRAMAH